LGTSAGALGALLALASPWAPEAGGQCTYDVTVIQAPSCGILGPPPTIGTAINEAGHVTGYQLVCIGVDDRAFFWTPEHGYQLLPMPAGVTSMRANDINDGDVIVGTMNLSGFGFRGFVYDVKAGEVTVLPPVNPSSGWSMAHGINNDGIVVGERSITDEVWPSNAFMWSKEGGFVDLGVMEGPGSVALAINGSGHVTGWTGAKDRVAFLLDEHGLTILPAVPGGGTSVGLGISDGGRVCGFGVRPDDTRGFTWQGEFVVQAPLRGFVRSAAIAFHAAGGSTVGETWELDGNPNVRRACLWQGTHVTDLNERIPPGTKLNLRSATASNLAGVIVGEAHDFRGDIVTFCLRPVSPVAGDLDGDCSVRFADLLLLLSSWGPCVADPCAADLDADGSVGAGDLLVMLGNWTGKE
jgi:probable HAF family extracellular repeat protein